MPLAGPRGPRGPRTIGLASAAALFVIFAAAGPALAAEKASPRAPGPVKITSDSMEAIRDKHLVIFRGDVVAEEDFLLCTDELYITYGEDNEIDDITARGNVLIVHEDRIASSREARYDRENRTLVLTGDPQIKQCTDMVRGEKITVYIDSDRATVEGGGGRVSAVIMPQKTDCAETPFRGSSREGAVEKTLCQRPR